VIKPVLVVTAGRDHINPLAHKLLVQVLFLSLLDKKILIKSLITIITITPPLTLIGLELSLVEGCKTKSIKDPVNIAGTNRILILLTKKLSSSDLKIACSFFLEFTIPIKINRAL
jgi:hypothetical protein